MFGLVFKIVILVCYVLICLLGKFLFDFGGKLMVVCVVEWVCFVGVDEIWVVIDYLVVCDVVEVYEVVVLMICVDY